MATCQSWICRCALAKLKRGYGSKYKVLSGSAKMKKDGSSGSQPDIDNMDAAMRAFIERMKRRDLKSTEGVVTNEDGKCTSINEDD